MYAHSILFAARTARSMSPSATARSKIGFANVLTPPNGIIFDAGDGKYRRGGLFHRRRLAYKALNGRRAGAGRRGSKRSGDLQPEQLAQPTKIEVAYLVLYH